MINKTLSGRRLRRSSDVSIMLMLTLGVVLGPALLIDLVAHLQAWSL